MSRGLPKEVEYLIDKLYEEEPSEKRARSSSRRLRPKIGNLYLFYYPDPKTKSKLPYFDALPLVLLFTADSKYLQGVNIHVIPYTWRINFIKAIMRTQNRKGRVDYADIRDAWNEAKIPKAMAYLAWRKYLVSRIKSNMKEFDHTNYLPVTRNVLGDFKKASADFILSDIHRLVKEKRAKIKQEKK